MHAWLQSIGMIVECSVVRVVVFVVIRVVAVVVDTSGCVVFSDVCGRGVVVGVGVWCVVLVTVENVVTGVVEAEVVSREAVVSALALVVVDAEEVEAGVV